MAPSNWSSPLFDDNPAEVDLIGLGPIAKVIAETVIDTHLDPVTVSVNSPWGGGKSTVLQLIALELAPEPTVLVVTIDPWEFVDSGDPRGTVISRVLDGLQRAATDHAAGLTEEGGVKARALETVEALGTRLNSLRRRVSWAKVAQVVAKSAITLTPDFSGLVDALVPTEKEEMEDAKGLNDFRAEFEETLQTLPSVSRVVVLVDDLDRCLPGDVLGAMEAIKLFLSVRGMAFVLAADEEFIRESVREALDRHGRGEFADHYTEKVVQLPFTLPRLRREDAESYIAILLAGDGRPDVLSELARLSVERRAVGNAPFAAPEMHEGLPTLEQVRTATAIVRGMSSVQLETPRQIKRFLNNFAVRSRIANAVFEGMLEEAVMKLWILEQNYSGRFAELSRVSGPERIALVQTWEAGSDEFEDTIADWASDGLVLSQNIDQVESYLALAASIVTDVTLGGRLTQSEAGLLRKLLDESDLVRRQAQGEMRDSPSVGDDRVAQHLASAVVGHRSDAALDSIQHLADYRGDLIPPMQSVLLQDHMLRGLGVEHVPSLAAFTEALRALRELRSGNVALVSTIDTELAGGL